MTNDANSNMVEKTCPTCGHRYVTDLASGLGEGCPKCLVDFLKEDGGATATMAPAGYDGDQRLVPGQVVGGVEVIGFLGRGGMGSVYKARQVKLDRVVALKVLDKRLAASPEFTSRFNREAKALAALNHPNIVHIYDYGCDDERHYLVMEFVDGASLREVLATRMLTPEAALRYVPQICDALEYAHSQGVIHRDVKPGNILIDGVGNLKVADFGLAKITAETDEPPSLVTATNRVMGTPDYMAPEQRRQTATVDHRADIYSLGVVFYEMLTGELPLGRFPMPSQRVKVDVHLDEVILKALDQDPERRYQRASQVKADMTGTPPRGSGGSGGGQSLGMAARDFGGNVAPHDHRKILGILFMVSAVLPLPLLLMVPAFPLLGPRFVHLNRFQFGGLLVLLLVCLVLLTSLIEVVAGYGLCTEKSWAKPWGLVAAGLNSFRFPLGTALGIYAFWALLCAEDRAPAAGCDAWPQNTGGSAARCDHRKILGALYVVSAVLNLPFFLMVLVSPLFAPRVVPAGGLAPSAHFQLHGPPFVSPNSFHFGGLFALLVFSLVLLTSLIEVVAAYGLWTEKSWAKRWGLVAAALNILHFPLGTALGVYGFWGLLRAEDRSPPAPTAEPGTSGMDERPKGEEKA